MGERKREGRKLELKLLDAEPSSVIFPVVIGGCREGPRVTSVGLKFTPAACLFPTGKH